MDYGNGRSAVVLAGGRKPEWKSVLTDGATPDDATEYQALVKACGKPMVAYPIDLLWEWENHYLRPESDTAVPRLASHQCH